MAKDIGIETFEFKVEVNDVGRRDFPQGLFRNRIPSNHENFLKCATIWNNELVKSSNNNNNNAVIFGADEGGGAGPQVGSVYLNIDWTQPFRDTRNAAPDSTIRPLWRCANAFMLKPNPLEELRWLLGQLAEDAAKDKQHPNKELLRIKAFDSQGVIAETESTVEMVAALREEGYHIGVEVAIPYSNGELINPNPYPDEFYVDKIVSAAKLAEKYGIPLDVFRVSLKDMVGELDAATATRLTSKIIDGLNKEGLKIKLGLHLHDTGLATEAYAAAIAVCKQKNWPISIDTVEGHDTSFASMLNLNQLLKDKYNIDLGLTNEQLNALKNIEELTDDVAKQYAVCRTEGKLSGEELRKFKIPGGGLASFESAVGAIGLAAKLGISQEDAVRVAGTALIAVGNLMGQPFAVTPGFQNKQIAALNFLNNLVEANILKNGMQLQELQEKVLTPLHNEQVEPLFLKGLNDVVKEFLRGDMPTEMHPIIRKILGHREGLLTDGLKSNLPEIKEAVTHMQKEGLVKEGKEAFNIAVSRAIVLGSPDLLRTYLQKPWWREADPRDYTSKDEYKRALQKFPKGLRPEPDIADKIREALFTRRISTDTATTWVTELLQAERKDIAASVNELLSLNQDIIKQTTNNLIAKQPLIDIIKATYTQQKAIISAKLENGEQFLYPNAERISIALQYLANELTQEENRGVVENLIKEVRHEIESTIVTAVMPGKILKVLVQSNEEVKKGQVLCSMEAMKMETTVSAPKDGVLSSIHIKPGDVVSTGQALIKYPQEQALDKSNVKIPKPKLADATPSFIEKLDSVLKQEAKVEPLTPLQQIGYNVPDLNKGEDFTRGKGQFIHVVGNRAGCAVKIVGDLTQCGQDVRVMYTDGDKTTPIIKYGDTEKNIKIIGYADKEGSTIAQDDILKKLKKLAGENPDKTVVFHPGWGFQAENDVFVARMENEFKRNEIVFAGPSSKPMRSAGGKKDFRDLVNEVAHECNPPYFGNEPLKAEELQAYIESGFSTEHKLDSIYREHFKKVQEMGGDVMIKANAGGGGRGIENFKLKLELYEEENYQAYVKLVAKNVAYSEKQFGDGTMLTERRMQGNLHHIEVQLAITNGAAILLGIRNCSPQIDKQKYIEMNVIPGDYPPELIESINKAAQDTANKLAEMGYNGLGTLEMLVNPETKEVAFLEVNTRIQVEHPVTEGDMFKKTGKRVPLPVLHTHLTVNDGNQTPQSILNDVFGFTAEDLKKTEQLAEQRVVHFRVVSKNIDLVNGQAIPTWVGDDKWPPHISAEIAKKYGVSLIQGGLGNGSLDPQIGAFCGDEKAVLAATTELLEAFRLAQMFERSTDKTNLETTLAMYPTLFKNGNVSYSFSISTTDGLVKGIHAQTIPSLEDKGKERLWPGQQAVDPDRLCKAIEQLAIENQPKIGMWENRVRKNSNNAQPFSQLSTGGISPKDIKEQRQAANESAYVY